MTQVAVFDLGSARSKLTIASDENGLIRFERHKVELGLGKAIGLDLPKHEIHSALESLAAIVKSRGCSKSIAVATEAFRKAPNGEAVVKEIEGLVGKVSIIPAIVEAKIVFASTTTLYGNSGESALVDVGGGSVQVVWGEEDDSSISLPLGTFRLEKEFQHDGAPLSQDELAIMREYLKKELSTALPGDLRRTSVVLGTNCMEDFFRSCLRRLKAAERDLEPLRLTSSTLTTILEEIVCRPYDELSSYYPENPMFMRGADKALLIAIAVANKLGVSEVVPTNEGVSTSLGRLAVAGADLSSLGVSVTDWL